jgi:hypothetical protein
MEIGGIIDFNNTLEINLTPWYLQFKRLYIKINLVKRRLLL